MTVSIDILQLFVLVIAIGGGLFSGFKWFSAVMEKQRETLEKLKDAITMLDKNSVTFTYCTEKRHSCPCFKDIEALRRTIRDYHKHHTDEV